MSSVDSEQAAAATITVTHFEVDDEDDPRFAGTRIKVNPDEADRVVSDTQVMRHELTHYLTARPAGAARRRWVTEGLAEWVSTAPANLDDLRDHRRLGHRHVPGRTARGCRPTGAGAWTRRPTT